MKKLAIGCGVVALVVIVAGGVGFYYVAHRVSSAVRSLAALGSIPDIEAQVQDKSPYEAPASGELTQEQLTKFLAVQAAVKQQLGARFDQLNSKYKALSDSLNHRDATISDAPSLLSAYRDLAATYVDAKHWQVEALNAQQLSLAQYRWIRERAYAAIGVPMTGFDIAQAVEDVKAGRTPEAQTPAASTDTTGLDANQKLVEPHRKELEDNVSLAVFGL
jgi:hypothetical protein